MSKLCKKPVTVYQKTVLTRLVSGKLSVSIVQDRQGYNRATYSDGSPVVGGPGVLAGLVARGLLRYNERKRRLHRKKDNTPMALDLSRSMVLSIRGEQMCKGQLAS